MISINDKIMKKKNKNINLNAVRAQVMSTKNYIPVIKFGLSPLFTKELKWVSLTKTMLTHPNESSYIF